MKKYSIILLVLTLTGTLFPVQLDFNRIKLDKLTTLLSLDENQKKAMGSIIEDESSFTKDGLVIKIDKENATQIINRRVERVRVLLANAGEFLSEEQDRAYLQYKADNVRDLFVEQMQTQLSLTHEQIVELSEIITMIKKLAQTIKTENSGFPPASMEGQSNPPDMQQGGENGGGMPHETVAVVDIFETALMQIVTEEQWQTYEIVQSGIREEFKRAFPEPAAANNRLGGGMGGGMGAPPGGGSGGMGR